MNSVVIVESPSKSKTIQKCLGPSFQVLASYGHVRDIPSKKDCVIPEKNFEIVWEMTEGSKPHIDAMKRALKKADKLILATDPDREGEAIAWHVFHILKDAPGGLKGVAVERVTFNAVTKDVVLRSMARPRNLDDNLIQAYLARRALDYLVGFTISPILWRKLPGARSAGRVQSVVLRLVCEKQDEIEAFVSEEYWSITGLFFQKDTPEIIFEAHLHEVDKQKLDKLFITNEAQAQALIERIEKQGFSVANIEKKNYKRHPAAPFITSTLQQEAARKLGFSVQRTMRIAQALYEGIEVHGELVGLITYMRTDSVIIIPEFVEEIRNLIRSSYGADYLPSAARVYKTKAKNAQEAHEAIRPTHASLTPDVLRGHLSDDEHKLYTLIWNRTIASQMENAVFDRTTVLISSGSGDLVFKATGSVLIFPGFLKVYKEGTDEKKKDDENARLPDLSVGEQTHLSGLQKDQHFTQPPPHYTEASLVKKMEELEIGRPSTYASTLAVLRDRGYAEIESGQFIPTDKGRLVTSFLEDYFTQYVEYDFTAHLEEKLDEISLGKVNWLDVLHTFWEEFDRVARSVAAVRLVDVLDKLTESMKPILFPPREDGSDPSLCPSCKGHLSLKTSKFGAFIGCVNYPTCSYTRSLFADHTGHNEEVMEHKVELIGQDPATGSDIFFKTGRFGPYFETSLPVPAVAATPAEGEGKRKRAKKKVEAILKRASIPRVWQDQKPSLEMALKLLSLPRKVGVHPETGLDVNAGNGRFGPFVVHDGVFAHLNHFEDIFNIGLAEAVEKIAAKAAQKAKGGKAGRAPRRRTAAKKPTNAVNKKARKGKAEA